MIVYKETVGNFINACSQGSSALDIGQIISDRMHLCGINYFDSSQVAAWKNSLPHMADVLAQSKINRSVDIAVEYKIQQSRDRIDFLVCGDGSDGKSNVVVVELKQWSSVSPSQKEDFVHTFGGHGEADYWHPSYQAYNYSQILYHFNEFIREQGVNLSSCSYLHNMEHGYSALLGDPIRFPLIEKSPVFYEDDDAELAKFIEKYIRVPNKGLLFEIENSRVYPSKYLADMLDKAIKGNDFFSYDEAQATSVASIVEAVEKANFYNQKKTIIIRGGAGTGKSVVAINVLGQLLKRKNGPKPLNAVYCTANASPRYLYTEKLIGHDYTKTAIKAMFKYPTVFVNATENFFDCALIDEAHRLFDFKAGVGISAGTHVLDSVIAASRISVFFIDDDQAVSTIDFATVDRIKDSALRNHSEVIEGSQLELKTQFRITGGEEYISFIKSVLGYNNDISFYYPKNYDFRVFDSADEMRTAIREKDKLYQKDSKSSGSCRMVAGYTYEWKSKGKDRDAPEMDIILDDGAFQAKWNLRCNRVGSEYSWINDPLSVEEVGCIHTCQGIDMNVCGVIIGKDLTYENGKLCFHQSAIARTDKFSGIRTADPQLAEKLIRNTYYVLLTRGMAGTYVYCEDPALRDHIRSMLQTKPVTEPAEEEIPDNLVYLPVVGEIAAGHEHFADEDIINSIPVKPSELHPNIPGKYFFLQVSGDSMSGAGIDDGDAVLIRRMSNPKADIKDGDVIACLIHGDRATLKTYYSELDGIRLHPENPAYDDIFVPMEEFMIGEARIIGKMNWICKG